jgi:hypothetical protein
MICYSHEKSTYYLVIYLKFCKKLMSVKVKYHLFEDNTIPIKNLSLSSDYMAFSTGLEDNWLSLMKMTVNPKTIQFDKGLVPSFSRRAISYL